MVGQSGLEPPTSRLSVVCSNQLSYWPIGGDERNRTADPLLARQVLSQLSYTPTTERHLRPNLQSPQVPVNNITFSDFCQLFLGKTYRHFFVFASDLTRPDAAAKRFPRKPPLPRAACLFYHIIRQISTISQRIPSEYFRFCDSSFG